MRRHRAANPLMTYHSPTMRMVLVGLLLELLSPVAVWADGPNDGLLIPIPASITSESTGRLRSLLHGPLKRFEQDTNRGNRQFVLLCDFNPEGRRAECEDFGACYTLASYLRSLPSEIKGVRTVAYIHGDVRRHSVLPVLACSEIVFSERGRLGDVARAGKPLSRVEQTAYEEITRNRLPLPLVRKMLDPNIELLRAGNEWLEAGGKLPADARPVAGLGAGEVALLTFSQARDFGLAQQLPYPSLDEVRVSYGIPRSSLRPTLERTVCWRIPLNGPITGELVEQTRRRIERALRARANLLIVEINTAGGDADRALALGQFLVSLRDRDPDRPVETVAYVTSKARNLATLVALSCNKIVMQLDNPGEGRDLNPDDEEDSLSGEARLGGFGLFFRRHPALEPIRKELAGLPANAVGRRAELERQYDERLAELEAYLTQNLVELASKQLYPVALARGFFSRSLRIYQVERAVGASGRQFLSEEDFQADQKDKKLWRSIGLVKPWQGQPRFEGHYLTLTARQAREIGLAQTLVRNLDELYESEGLIPAEVRTAEADWMDGLADFLRHPWVSVLLVMVGILCLMLELKMPGVGLPGVLAAICFVLFFWAHSQLSGQITWLAILLFLLGLVLIGLEVFVLPGFGVCGISGILLLLSSLGLVAYGHWPQSGSEWISLGNKMAPFTISLLGAVVCLAVVVRYLPHIPVLNRLMLRSVEEEEDVLAVEPSLHGELQGLLGAIGVAATPLRPAGKAQFGETFVDVVTEGNFVRPGMRVQVIEVEGNRVVVKEV